MWREFIQSLESKTQRPFDIEFANGVSPEQLAMVEAELGVALPKDLYDLLGELNGVYDQYGLGIIWSVEAISQYNREMRTLSHYKECYMSFTDMLFFADAGNGDRFAFPIIEGKVRATRIYAWDHEDDSRREVAFTLKSYLERLMSGKIKL